MKFHWPAMIHDMKWDYNPVNDGITIRFFYAAQ